MNSTPEIDKMHAVKGRSQAIGEFLDWLQSEKGWELAQYHEHDDSCYTEERKVRICRLHNRELIHVNFSIEKLLAEFFDIDLAKVDDEKRAILEQLRRAA